MSQEYPPEERDKFLGRLNGLFRGIFSAKFWARSQWYYYGSVKKNSDHRVEIIEGQAIDLADELDECWTGKADTKPSDKTNGAGHDYTSRPLDPAALLKAIRAGQSYHAPMVRLAGYAACQGKSLLETRKFITDAMESIPKAERDARWRQRFADLDRCLIDVYGKEAGKREKLGINSRRRCTPAPHRHIQPRCPRRTGVHTDHVGGSKLHPRRTDRVRRQAEDGKSWMMLNVALGVARGKEALGQFVDKGHVLYCGLEDGERRMQSRVRHVVGPHIKGWPANFHVRHKLDPIEAGGLETLEAWLIEHRATARLVVIDTLGKVRGMKGAREEQYQYDYRILGALQELATKYRIAIVVVHHVRKTDAQDVLDTVSGTTGIAGAADNVMVLGRTDKGARLYLRGRDAEEQDKLVEFDPDTGIWEVTGDYDGEDPAGRLQGLRRQIFELLNGSPAPLTPANVAERLRASPNNVRQALRRMAKAKPPQAFEAPGVAGAYTAARASP